MILREDMKNGELERKDICLDAPKIKGARLSHLCSTGRLGAEIFDYGFEDPRIHANKFWIRETINDY